MGSEDVEWAISELEKLVKALTERVDELQEQVDQHEYWFEYDFASTNWLFENTNVVMNPEPEKPDAA